MELSVVKGVSQKRIEELNKMGVFCVEDLCRVFPKGYLDLRKTSNLKDAVNNSFVLTVGTVVSIPSFIPRRGNFSVFKIFCEQNGEPFTVVWFNQPYFKSKLKEGETYLFYGRLRNKYAFCMTNPSFEPIDENFSLKGIIPVYPTKGSLTQKVMRSIIKDGLQKLFFESAIPRAEEARLSLGNLNSAYRAVHNPITLEEAYDAADRIAVEEYFLIISAFKQIKGDRREPRSKKYSLGSDEIKEFCSRFPFEFTDGQKKAVNEIYSDLKSPFVMNRLLQGDVGSGKTAVSLVPVYVAAKSGRQAVMLAPTEVLARQNYGIIKKFLPEFETELLCGSTNAKEKKRIKDGVFSGKTKILVGTHAVLQGDVEFFDLAVCVCDEQQRFGVAQRSALLDKGFKPDLLAMSATPIPRTLSLIFYGDLEISTIKDKPRSRAEVQTGIVSKAKYSDMINFIYGQIKEGRQCYFVCPKIEGDDEGSIISVTELYDELKKLIPSARLALLHGRMKEEEKTAVMTDFKEGKIDGIVSTTVIEVGIDVPNATVMAIFGADRFGLSQLHQLRGRVGRSDLKSYCFLLSDSDNEKSLERLRVLKNNSDGFKIAERDFEERGGGDFMGTRQSGRFAADLGLLKYSSSAIFIAKKLADEAILSKDEAERIKSVALEKYSALKDVALN